MREIIERAAKAVAGLEFLMPGAGGPRGTLHVAPAMSIEIVRAVLRAIREPSDDMICAGMDWAECEPESLNHAWSVMIDAALAEGESNRWTVAIGSSPPRWFWMALRSDVIRVAGNPKVGDMNNWGHEGVVVTTADREQEHARLGDTVVRHDDGTFSVEHGPDGTGA